MNKVLKSADIILETTGLLEGPTWDGIGLLYYTNVTDGGIYALDVATRTSECVVEHRKGMGGLALTYDGNYIVSGRNIAMKSQHELTTTVLAEGTERDKNLKGYNDLTTDSEGAVICGALGEGALNPKTFTGRERAPAEGEGTGTIWKITGSKIMLLAGDIGHPNGIALHPSGKFAYISDTLRRLVYKYYIDDGNWHSREVFFSFSHGQPDGIALAEDGTLFIALALAGKIVAISERKEIVQEYALPTEFPTSIAFGGIDMKTAFVTSGAHGDSPAFILEFRTPVPGVPIPRAII
jgi:sugar lactone lactonase YvrE